MERSRFGWRNEDGDRAGGQFPQRGGTLLLHVGVRREIFKGEHIVRGEADDPRRIDRAGELAAGAQRGSSASAALLSATTTMTGCLAARASSGM